MGLEVGSSRCDDPGPSQGRNGTPRGSHTSRIIKPFVAPLKRGSGRRSAPTLPDLSLSAMGYWPGWIDGS